MLNRVYTLAKVAFRLGLFNIARVVFYRLRLRLGCLKRLTPLKQSVQGQLFSDDSICLKALPESLREGYVGRADLLLLGQHSFFFNQKEMIGNPPKWRQWNESCEGLHWTKVAINMSVGEDVKQSWDLSRFHWMPTLAAAYAVSEDEGYLQTINEWFADWSQSNPPNSGVNWVCAQEVSIRLVNLLNTAYLLGVHNSRFSDTFLNVIMDHCQRIYPTIGYAVAQENNHGVTEASALYIAGNWLEVFANESERANLGRVYSKRGRKVLELLSKKLVLADGGFAMSSFSYHRVVLDTLSMVEFWRETLNLSKFTSQYYYKASLLVDFLYQVHDLTSGDVPNVGANDGSRSYLLTDSDYRDFRPSLQISSGYFSDSRAFDCDQIEWFSASLPKVIMPKWRQETRLFKESGFMKLISEDSESWALVRFPSFHFRPSQSDALHFDLWWRGRNILTDSGSYSYNCSKDIDDYFSGAAGHNVVQFDGRESMPRIGKFLWGEWLKAERVTGSDLWVRERRWQCSFTDYLGARHNREVSQKSGNWLVSDSLSGFLTATLRWHLEDKQWSLNGNIVESDDIKIIIRASGPISLRLVCGWKSLYYSQRIEVPILEVLTESGPIKITTEIQVIK